MPVRARASLRSVSTLGMVALAVTLAPLARAQGWEANVQEDPPPAATAQPAEAPVPPSAAASGAGSAVDFEIGGQVGYTTGPIRGGTNPFGAGFGGRLGFAFKSVYFGASIINYLGGNDVDVSYRSLLYGVELGYGFRLPVGGSATLTLRPLLGLGVASVYYTDPALAADVVTSASGGSSGGGSDTLTVNALYLQPALLTMISSGHNFAALGVSMLDIPSITYGGAAAAEWRSYSGQLQLGFVF